MDWRFDDDRAIYSQIVQQMKQFIVSGHFAPGEKLASVRDFAAEAGVNPNTMQRAFAELERGGLVFSNRTAGRFITENAELIENVRREFAKNRISEFLAGMKTLGINAPQAARLIENYNAGGDFGE